jgi:5-dehydro-2-deoxygluconokinase
VSVDPARQTQLDMLAARGRPEHGSGRFTVLDLDWRPMFWPSPLAARREYVRMLQFVTVAVGNRDEVEVAVGTRDPEEGAPGCSTWEWNWRSSRKVPRECCSPPRKE